MCVYIPIYMYICTHTHMSCLQSPSSDSDPGRLREVVDLLLAEVSQAEVPWEDVALAFPSQRVHFELYLRYLIICLGTLDPYQGCFFGTRVPKQDTYSLGSIRPTPEQPRIPSLCPRPK